MIILKQSNILTLPDGMYPDGNNLYFRVRSQGKYREFLYRCTIDGKATYRSLGTARKLTLKEARQKAKEYVPKPSLQKILFKNAYKDAIPIYGKHMAWKHMEEYSKRVESLVRRKVVPILGDKVVSEITTKDISQALLPMWINQHSLAKNLYFNIKGIFKAFIIQGLCESNPAEWDNKLEFYLPSSAKLSIESHYPFVPFKDIPDVFSRIYHHRCKKFKDSDAPSKRLVIFVILSCLRVGEAVTLKWSYLKEDPDLGMYLDIPAKNRKGHKKVNHHLPVTSYMEEFLKNQPRVNEYIFGSLGTLTGYLNKRSASKIFHGGLKGIGSTFHGFRSSFRSWAADNNLNYDACELILSHEIGNRVTRSYYRTDLYHKRKEILTLWNKYLFSNVNIKK